MKEALKSQIQAREKAQEQAGRDESEEEIEAILNNPKSHNRVKLEEFNLQSSRAANCHLLAAYGN